MCGCHHDSTQKADKAISGAKFEVADMTCGHCVSTIRRALEETMPGTPISINLESHEVTVAGDAVLAEQVIRDAGYEPQLLSH